MIRLLALYPATDRDALASIRRAATGLRGTPGLVGLAITRRLEPVGGSLIFGPAVELSFADAAALHTALRGGPWRALAAAGAGGGVTLHAHEVEPLNAGALGLAPNTTDVDVADEEADAPEEELPVSTQLRYPSARPADDDGDAAA